MTAVETKTINFYSAKSQNAILALYENGDIFVNGRLAENDKEVVDAMREFLLREGLIKNKEMTEFDKESALDSIRNIERAINYLDNTECNNFFEITKNLKLIISNINYKLKNI
jgi:hypothetical protein